MRKGENANPVPSELYSAAQDGILVSTDGVKDYYEKKNQSEINQELRQKDSQLEETKADKADTLEGYGITDAYTKDEVDQQLRETVSNLNLARVATTGDYNDLENTPDLTLKVDTVEGKGLSTNDFTDEDKLAVDSLKDKKYQFLDILFSDGTVSSIYEADPTKIPVGICYGTSDQFPDKKARFAALYNGYTRWGSTGNIYGIPKYTTKQEALQDFDGKDHTEELVKTEYSTVYRQLPAADFCKTYNPEGYGLGEWYVPSVGELNVAFENDGSGGFQGDVVNYPEEPTEKQLIIQEIRRVFPNITLPVLADVDYSGSNYEYVTTTYGGIEDGKEYIWYQKYFNSSWDWFDDDWIDDDDPWDPYNGDLWGDDNQDNTQNNVEPTRNLTRGTNEPSRGKPLGNWGHDFERSERVDRDMRFVPFIQVEERIKKSLSTNDYTNEDKTLVDNMKYTYNFLDYLYDDLTVSSELVSGKTPIGICVIPTGQLPDGNARFMALKNLELYCWDCTPPEFTELYLVWENDNYVHTTAKSEAKARVDYDGIKNTQLKQNFFNKWRDDGDNRVYAKEQNLISTDSSIFEQVTERWSLLTWYYNPGLTNKGDWYIPAAGEFLQLKNIELINQKIQEAGGKELDNNYYWTSTESTESDAYRACIEGVTTNGVTTLNVSIQSEIKDSDNPFRPFIQIPSNRVEKLEKTKIDKEEGKGLSTMDYSQEDKELVNSLKSPEYHVYDFLFDDGSVGTELSDEKTPVGICISVNNNEALFFALKKLCINTCKGQTFGLSVTWYNAMELAKEFSPGAYNGQWRLPTRQELLIQYNMSDELYDYLLELMPNQRSDVWNIPSWAVWTSDKSGNNYPYYIDYDDGSAIISSYDNQCDAWAVISLQNKNPYATKEYVLNNINESPTARPFHSSWRTNTTLANFCSDIVSDSTTLIGNSYLGELRCTGLPTGMINGEVRVDVLGESNNNKILLLTVTSTNLSPYHWELTYFNGIQHGWRKWVLDDDYVHTDNNFTNADKNKLSNAVQTSELYETYTPNGHDYVEIGGIKWATMNVGASSVTDTGLYFQWGDTQGYTANQVGNGTGQKAFEWQDYVLGNGSIYPGGGGMAKYNSTDHKTILEPSDDAVTVAWGNGWRIPTKEDFAALSTATTAAWTADYEGSGVAGLVLTDTTDSSKTLFFPACGACNNSSVYNVGNTGYYWSSSLNTGVASYEIMFSSSHTNWQNSTGRQYGHVIRGIFIGETVPIYATKSSNNSKADKVQSAVRGNFAALDFDGNIVDSGHKHSDYLTQQINANWNENNISSKAFIQNKPRVVLKNELYNIEVNNNGHTYVDLNLPSGTLWATMNVGANSITDYGNYYQYGKGADTWQTTESQNDYSGTESPLSLSVDTARQCWGGSWHMPSRVQIQELLDCTTHEWINNYQNSNINGCLFTGDNGNVLFIPASGRYWSELEHESSYGYIWSSDQMTDDFYGFTTAYQLRIWDNSVYIYGESFSDGVPVRPVIEPSFTPIKENIIEIQTVSSGTTLTAVTEKLYKFTYAVSDLTVTLTAPTITTKVSLYTFRFLTDSTVTNIIFNTPANTRLLEPDNLSWDADTEYEVSIMFDGLDYVMSYNKYVVHIQSINP